MEGLRAFRNPKKVVWELTSLSRDASRYSLLGLMTKSLFTSVEGCSPCLLGAYIILRIASLTEFLETGKTIGYY